METLEYLIEQNQNRENNNADVIQQLESWLSSGFISEGELSETVKSLSEKHKISKTLAHDIQQLILSASGSTVFTANTDQTQIAQSLNSDKTVVSTADNDATVISQPTPASSSSDISDDATVMINTDATVMASTDVSDNDATVVATGHTVLDGNATQLADEAINRDSAATEISSNIAIADQSATELATPSSAELDQTALSTTPPDPLGFPADLTEPVISEPTVVSTGSIIKDRFILKEVIGAGGMSIVYKALDKRKLEAKNSNPYVAIKVLGDVFKNHLQSLLVLERESQQIQKLAHPNIVTVYDFDRERDVIYMTMEALSGKSLDQIISQNKQGMPYEKVVPFVEGMCRGLAYAHSKNIIHSDFKPENVFFTKEKVVKILDFGIARAKQLPDAEMNEEFDAGTLGALTPPYASCEMFENKDPDPRDDIYALGCVTYKLLTGEHPFDGMPAIKAREKKLKPKRLNNLTKRQWKTLEASLSFERESRIPTVIDFLNGFLPKKRSPWVYATAAAAMITISVAGYSWFFVSTQPEIPQIKLTEDQQNTIANALETAEIYISMGYLASPPGDSALDQFDKVLSIDPTNLTAIDGKKKIAQEYLDLALQEIDKRDYEQSLALIKTGLVVEPDNESLKALQNDVKNLRAKQ